MRTYRDYLDKIWHDPSHPAAFSGPSKLYRYVKLHGLFPKLGLSRVTAWLNEQDEYSLQRNVRKKYNMPGAYIEKEGVLMELDLMQMSTLSRQNNGIKFVICLIDVFSRKLYTEPVKAKDGETVAKGTEKLLSLSGWPNLLKTDRGAEFTSNRMMKMLQEHGVKQIFTENETKSNYIERAIQTVKNKIFRYFTKYQTYKYVKNLKKFTDSYNNTYHRVIGMAPAEVNKKTRLQAWYNQYIRKYEPKHAKVKKDIKPGKKRRKYVKKTFKYRIGDKVRVSFIRSSFPRSYEQKWSDEIFSVTRRYLRENVPVYKLQDIQGEDISGSFYQHEMMAAVVRPDKAYRISAVLKSRKRKNHEREFYVHWDGWAKRFRSWVRESDMVDIKQDESDEESSSEGKEKIKLNVKGKK